MLALLLPGEAVLGCVGCFLAVPSAALGRWAEADERLARALVRLDSTGTADVDVAWALTRLGDLALEAGDTARGRAALTAAAAQWTSVGRAEEAAALADRLAALG